MQRLLNSFKNNFDLTPCIGAELEFYLLLLSFPGFIHSSSSVLPPHNTLEKTNKNNFDIQSKILLLERNCNIKIKTEKGQNQYEIAFPPSEDIFSYPYMISSMRESIIRESINLGLRAVFLPKPFLKDFGSSMHIHFNFLEDNNAEKYAEMLCHYLPSTVKAFLPEEEDYLRLDHRFNAPTHISYGNNNRTTLIRIPDSLPRRLEHRLAGANADPYKVIYAILFSINEGLKYPKSIPKLDKTYGNAYDPQYGLKNILSTR